MKHLTHLTDEQLEQLHVNGEADALVTLAVRYKEKIYTHILVKVKDRYLADDILQDVFIRIVETKHYNAEGKFLPWAMRIAHNLYIDHYRKLKRCPFAETDEEDEIYKLPGLVIPGTDEKMMADESYAKIRKMVDLLPKDQREVVIMRHYANLSFKEISVITKCNINTALGRMRYGLKNLRQMVRKNQMDLFN